jgi:hypothetical protein
MTMPFTVLCSLPRNVDCLSRYTPVRAFWLCGRMRYSWLSMSHIDFAP